MNDVLSSLLGLTLSFFLFCPAVAIAQVTTFVAHYSVVSIEGTESKKWTEDWHLVATETDFGHTFKKVVTVVQNNRTVPVGTEESDLWSTIVVNDLETLRFSYVLHPNYAMDKTFGHVKVQRKGAQDIQHPVFVTIEMDNGEYLSTETIMLPHGEKIVTTQRYGAELFDLPLNRKVSRFKPDQTLVSETYYTLKRLGKL